MPAATLRLFNLLTLLAWPLLVWLALTQPHWQGLFWLLALLFSLRWLQLRRQQNAMGAVMGWLALLGALLCVSSQLLRAQHLLLWYPVAVNLTMLLVFAASLRSAMPLAERIARLREPELPAAAVSYTRRVTQVWCLFFIGNGSMALLTCLNGDLRLWTLWNGGISYLLIAALMGTEWLIRQRVRRKA
ncbi:hypothetical protein [Pantoea vagans]|uniref:COG4648 family protein n=1 Tax=Pantoea vagans TaxID=470934 RepID=UPI0023B0C588|nr:hypothetical protein [Pantoea vagans]MDE8555447.1 hypothetical protein [Pantoea vagans]MDE8575498.1 hypothetical protein [Pantoea vagans]